MMEMAKGEFLSWGGREEWKEGEVKSIARAIFLNHQHEKHEKRLGLWKRF